MSEFEKHMVPMTFEEALKVFDQKPTEIKDNDIKEMTLEEAIKVIEK